MAARRVSIAAGPARRGAAPGRVAAAVSCAARCRSWQLARTTDGRCAHDRVATCAALPTRATSASLSSSMPLAKAAVSCSPDEGAAAAAAAAAAVHSPEKTISTAS